MENNTKEIKGDIAFPAIISGFVFSLVISIILGLHLFLPLWGLFSASIWGAISWSYKKNNISLIEIQKLGILAHGPGNHFVGIESRGGLLCLTRDELIFKPHSVNIQKDYFHLLLKDIQDWSEYSVMGVFPMGIKILKTNGTTEKLVVYGRSQWLELFSEYITKMPTKIRTNTSMVTSSNLEIKDLEKLASLHKEGVLSDEEFIAAKKKVLS